MIFRNFRIIYRIGLVIAIFCFLMIVLAIVEYLGVSRINKNLEQLVDQTYVKVELAQDMRFLARHKAVIIRNILLLEDQAAKEFELQRIKEEENEYAKALDQLTELSESPNEKAVLERIITGQQETNLLWDRVIQYGMEGKTAGGTKLLVVEVRSKQWGWLDSLNEMVDLQKEIARRTYTYELAASTKTNMMLIIIDLLAIGLGLFLAIVISRSITAPLRDFTGKVEKIAQGDLSVRVDYDTKDEIGMLGNNINRMVTMRKKNLEELEAYRQHLEELVEQRTEELNRQREEFISVLIHDLKGPITPIVGFTSRLIEGKAKTPEETLTYLKNIENSTQQLLSIIEKTSKDLRDKSALDVFNPEEFDFSALTRTIAESFLPRMDDGRINLQINNLDKDGWKNIEVVRYTGDPSQLRTLVENLLGNALKYARSRIQIEIRKANHALYFNITDDGPGIAKEYREKIFEQYFQIPGSLKGTGIGLYSVMKVVENHQGSISVDSLPDKGACFKVVLPDTGS